MLGIEGKSNDTIKARLDLADRNIRKDLYLKYQGSRVFKPAACFTLVPRERRQFCEFLKSLKFSDGHAANISKIC